MTATYMRIFFFLLLSFGFLGKAVNAENGHRFLSTGFSRARALAMGGAYHSVVDDFSSGIYNPGAFKLNATADERKFRLFFNPAGSAVLFNDYADHDRDYARDGELTAAEGLYAASMIFKGIVLEHQFFDLGVNFGEEIIASDSLGINDKRFFSAEGQSLGSFNSAFMNVKIASSVSLGITGTMYRIRDDGETSYYGGYTFGVLMNPNPKLHVGLAYNSIPDEVEGTRFQLESLEGETVTGGVSYYPDENSVISVDVRNLNKEDKNASREIHVGLERCFFDRVALRAGYFRKKQTRHDVYSFGIGILPGWKRISKFVNSSRNDILSYTFILEENGQRLQWHVFSLLLRY